MYNVGFLGNIVEVPEFLLHHPEFKLKKIICEADKYNDDLFTFSLVRKIEIYTTNDIKELETIIQKDVTSIDCYLMCSFGKKVSQKILDMIDIYNIHYSNLPFYKGRHPTFWATIQDEKNIGISLHKVSSKIDEGDIICQEKVPYYIWMDEENLSQNLTNETPKLIDALSEYLDGNNNTKQNVCGHYYKPVSKSDYTINLYKDEPAIIYNKVRAQKKYRGARLIIKKCCFWIKKMKFTTIENLYEVGELYYSKDGELSIYYKNGIALKLLNYQIEVCDEI